jgi:uncharacterized membrane protein
VSERAWRSAFLVLVAVIAIFVLVTSMALPPIVASHFGPAGAADGFMSRSVYTIFLLVMAVGAPLCLAFLPASLIRKRGDHINLPNRAYWLAPERRETTTRFLRLYGLWFAMAVALFLAYVHWLVVQANRLQPPTLSNAHMIGALVVFFVFLAVWLVVLFRRFRVLR